MIDPRFRTLYPHLADAPEPTADGFWIAVVVGSDEVQDYVSKNGEYVPYGRRYTLEQNVTVLSERDHAALTAAIEAPPEPNEKLKSLLRDRKS